MARGRVRVMQAVVAVAVAGAVLLAVRLGALERADPAHAEISIGDGIPATLYLPSEFDDGALPYQRPDGERPPVVVVAHGYSGDRAIMSPLARSLAEAGYAVVSFDFRGHGSDTRRFAGDIVEDVEAVIDHVERSPLVDDSRLALVGHSMGAGAVLEAATLDRRVKAVVPISGGWTVNDEAVPEHALLIAAQNDPPQIRDRQVEVAGTLRAAGADVATKTVASRDHITILFADETVREVVGFLDDALDVPREGRPPGLDDPRLRVAALYLLFALALIAFAGSLLGRLSTALDDPGTSGGLLLVAGALAATIPVMAVGGVDILPVGAGQSIVVQFLLAGTVLWAVRILATRGVIGGPIARWAGPSPWPALRAALGPGLAGGLALFLVLLPLAGVSHRMVPTTPRLVLWAVMGAMALPFFAAFEFLVRRGSTWQAVGWGVAGRVVLLGTLVLGLAAGLLPSVLGLVLPLLVAQFVAVEVFAAGCYGHGRNPLVIAVTESVLVAWMAVTLTPIG